MFENLTDKLNDVFDRPGPHIVEAARRLPQAVGEGLEVIFGLDAEGARQGLGHGAAGQAELSNDRGHLFHLLDVLRGKRTPKVLQYGHESLSTFGIGGALPEDQWRTVLRQLVRQFASPLVYLLLFALCFDIGLWVYEGGHGWPVEAIAVGVILLLNALLGLLKWAVIISAIISWLVAFDVINLRNNAVYQISRFLDAVTALGLTSRGSGADNCRNELPTSPILAVPCAL